jgi:hypothetical protein
MFNRILLDFKGFDTIHHLVNLNFLSNNALQNAHLFISIYEKKTEINFIHLA